MRISRRLGLIAFALVWCAPFAIQAESIEPPPQSQPTPGPATGLSDSAGLRATVFGTPPEAVAPLPAKVPLYEINVTLPWRLPVPEILW